MRVTRGTLTGFTLIDAEIIALGHQAGEWTIHFVTDIGSFDVGVEKHDFDFWEQYIMEKVGEIPKFNVTVTYPDREVEIECVSR